MYKNILAEMTRKGISMADISNLVDIPESNLHDMLNCETPMSLEQAIKIYQEVFPDKDFLYLFKK